MKDYTNQEIINFILNAKLSDIYFTILEKQFISKEEFDNYFCEGTVIHDQFLEILTILKNKGITDYDTIKEFLLLCANLNEFRVLIKIDDKLYDIYQQEFIDLSSYKVVKFSKVSNCYRNSKARTVLVTPKEAPNLDRPYAFLDFDDMYAYNNFKSLVQHDFKNVDLTDNFKMIIGLSSGFTR